MIETADIPILYSFRRCPYAMRARMGLMIAQQKVLLREVVLRDKPDAMIKASAKATVPVMVLPDGNVIDQSIDIVRWALGQNDPKNWLKYETAADSVIEQADGPFKSALDRYKYHVRYDNADPHIERSKALTILMEWDKIIGKKGCFFGEKIGLADIAIFPFVRQFANHDRIWFDAQSIPHIHTWLAMNLESDLFTSVMHKYDKWQEGNEAIIFVAQ